MRLSPCRPRRVRMTMTPLAACAPYCAAADASFSTSTDSMSSGLRLGFCPMYMPSTTYSGEAAFRNVWPRMMTCAGRPGSPVAAMSTPAACPRSASSSVATCWFWSCSWRTLAVASDTSRRCCVV